MIPFLKRASIRLLALMAVAAVVLQVRHYIVNVHPRASSDVQRVTLVNPRPETPQRAPDPEKEDRTPAPSTGASAPAETSEFFKYDEYAPSPSGATGQGDGPPNIHDDMLGLDTAGGAGSDAYGLVGKRGGKDVTTLANAVIGDAPGGSGEGGGGHGQGGAMAKFSGYATLLKNLLTAELYKHDDLRTADYEAIVMVWIEQDGRVKRSSLSKPTGIARMDDGIRQVLAQMPALPMPPPPDMPQPIHLKISSTGAVEAKR